jgi:hypothetical protein
MDIPSKQNVQRVLNSLEKCPTRQLAAGLIAERRVKPVAHLPVDDIIQRYKDQLAKLVGKR